MFCRSVLHQVKSRFGKIYCSKDGIVGAIAEIVDITTSVIYNQLESNICTVLQQAGVNITTFESYHGIKQNEWETVKCSRGMDCEGFSDLTLFCMMMKKGKIIFHHYPEKG